PHQGRGRRAGNAKQRKPAPIRAAAPERVEVPPELVEDFRILGLLPGVTPGECRDAWKLLMKKHHPDKNNQSGEATRITTRINNSYNRIIHWYKTGELT
ncbi:MAG TPA: J domain-containing protein, partial [Treponemataceae bacterium]|nr:J domain-containing protein [Treponemataceae bacterium]